MAGKTMTEAEIYGGLSSLSESTSPSCTEVAAAALVPVPPYGPCPSSLPQANAISSNRNTGSSGSSSSSSSRSNRMARTEKAYIEDVFEKYSAVPGMCSLAVGASGWSPPVAALDSLPSLLKSPEIHNYGSNMGLVDLREGISRKLTKMGLDMADLEVNHLVLRMTFNLSISLSLFSYLSPPSSSPSPIVAFSQIMVTCGGNQAYTNAILALCDEGDRAVVLAPYYCSHIVALQLAGASIDICPFEPNTLQPSQEALQARIAECPIGS